MNSKAIQSRGPLENSSAAQAVLLLLLRLVLRHSRGVSGKGKASTRNFQGSFSHPLELISLWSFRKGFVLQESKVSQRTMFTHNRPGSLFNIARWTLLSGLVVTSPQIWPHLADTIKRLSYYWEFPLHQILNISNISLRGKWCNERA